MIPILLKISSVLLVLRCRFVLAPEPIPAVARERQAIKVLEDCEIEIKRLYETIETLHVMRENLHKTYNELVQQNAETVRQLNEAEEVIKAVTSRKCGPFVDEKVDTYLSLFR